MMHVHVSPASAVRREVVATFLRDAAPGQDTLLVGVTREAADDAVRAFLRERGGATFGLHRLGFGQLVSHLGTPHLAKHGLAPASPLATQAAAARAAFDAKRRGDLPRLGPVSGFPGFPRALTQTLTELRRRGVDTDQIAEPDAEVAALLRGFQQEFAGGSVADRVRLLEFAIEAVARDADPLLDAPVLLHDVPLRSPQELRFVQALAARAPSCTLTVAGGDEPTLELLRSHPEVEWHEHPEEIRSGLTALRRHVFRDPPEESRDPDPSVAFFSAPGEGRECVEIVRQILAQADAGIPFDQMAVFLRAPEIYAGLLEAALRRANVPVFSTRGTRLPDPAGRAFLALLACRAEGLSARRFAEYLSFAVVPPLTDGLPPEGLPDWAPPQEETLGPTSVQETVQGQLALPFDTPAPPEPTDDDATPRLAGALRAPSRWENYLVEAAVIGGKDRWHRRLAGFQRELEIQRRELAERDPESAKLRFLDREQTNAAHLERFALPIIDHLDDMPAEARWGEWLDRLSALAPKVLAEPERVLSVLTELRPMSAVGPVTLDEVRTVLANTLSTLETSPPRHRYGRVFVGTPEQARGHDFSLVFVPGLAERVFPERPREDPLLLDAVRVAIDAGLDTQEDRVREERLRLRLALGAARDRVVLSYPRVNMREARPRVPSFYAIDVDRASRGEAREFSKLEREAEDRVHARLAWPAPHNPDEALDNTEHDLAVLHDLLHAEDTASVKGRGRYLLELNGHLARSLRSRWLRFEARKWTPADGIVESEEVVRAALDANRLAQRPYSVTALQRFATCPYQFLLGAIHRLQPREEPVSPVQMDPLTRGNLMHQVQAEILRDLRDAGDLPVRPDTLAAATARLDATLDRVAEQFHDDIAPAIERVWEDEIVGMRTDLRVWMRELAESGERWVPAYFEYAFGLPRREGHDAASRSEPITIPNGWQLRGAIDLIETSADGTILRVTDHKTGKNRTSVGTVVAGGETLQPVLYSLVAETALGKPVEEGRLSFATARGGFSERAVPIDDRARYYGNQVLEIIDRALETGLLVPAPREGACKWCDFRTVCGPFEEQRTARKDRSVLEDLRELRLLP